MTNYGWQTTKTDRGFSWTVHSVSYGAPTVVHQSGVCRTRAQAMGRAKKWVLYYRRTRDRVQKEDRESALWPYSG